MITIQEKLQILQISMDLSKTNKNNGTSFLTEYNLKAMLSNYTELLKLIKDNG